MVQTGTCHSCTLGDGTELPLLGVVEDDTERVAPPSSQAAHTVPKIHPVVSAFAFDWTMMDSECYRVSLSKWNYLGSRLHAGTLLDEHKLAPSEIPAWLR